MEAFPFTAAEWDAVQAAALPVVNATFAEDDVLRASCVIELLDVLAELRGRHGGHPVLLETEADFTDDEERRIALYDQAARLADEHGLPTLSIRVSLARVLLGLRRPADVRRELLSCEREVGDIDDRTEWSELMRQAGG